LGHFWLILGFILGSFSHVWKKNDLNDLKNGMKNDVKNGYCEHPGKQKCILHGPCQCWQVLSIFKLPLKQLGEIIFMNWSLKLVVSPHSLQTCYYV